MADALESGGLDAGTALATLRRANFDWTRTLRSVWEDPAGHVADVNGPVLTLLADEFEDRTRAGNRENPIGRVILGPPGSGKTHLLGALRAEVWRRDGFFVLLDMLGVRDFWDTAAVGMMDALGQPMPDGRTQAQQVLARLTKAYSLPTEFADQLRSTKPRLCKLGAKGIHAGLRQRDVPEAHRHADATAAFALLDCGDMNLRDLARAWLLGEDLAPEDRDALGVNNATPSRRAAIEGLSWLMSLAGPTMIAVDQLDAIVAVAHSQAGMPLGEDPTQRNAQAIIDGLAGGLMALRDVTRRSMTVISTLESTWSALMARALGSFHGRFHDPLVLTSVGSVEAARAIVAGRMSQAAAVADLSPPYPTWPFRPEAFEPMHNHSPRLLLRACEAHRALCVAHRQVTELASFPGLPPTDDPQAVPHDGAGGRMVVNTPPALPMAPPEPPGPDIDALYDRYRTEAAASSLLDASSDGVAAGLLIVAALKALIRQGEPSLGRNPVLDDSTPGLQARLRVLDPNGSVKERDYLFLALPHSHAGSVQARLRAAISASGIDRNLPFRRLVILRNADWPSGTRTRAVVSAFQERGGRVMTPDEADFRRFSALRELLRSPPVGFDQWLRDRRPLAESPFFRELGLVSPPSSRSPSAPAKEAVSEAPTRPTRTEPSASASTAAPPAAPPLASPSPPATAAPRIPLPADTLPLGVRAGDGRPMALSLTLLPKHVAVIAGSGSGKTVLLRRIIEEAALAGIPSIVLDSNNDLVRLGDPWPEPSPLTVDDSAKAARLAERSEVVVWTPGRSRGNPLALPPLPDFAAVRDDDDERELAVGVAAAALEPLIGAAGATGQLKQGVLSSALRHFARAGGGRLDDLVALLRDLPEDTLPIEKAPKIAGGIADALLAARSRNPLFDGAGTPLDPATLLTGAAGRTRISVVNLAGLPGDEARQDFVGRLLMALFSHVRRHPASADVPASGLLVMDEAQNFVPSTQGAASKQATLALVRQARKYGLGMLFATQLPKSLDHGILNNCTTQLYGRTNSPTAIDTVREVMAARGGAADDLGRLDPGVFYLTTEGLTRPQKILAPRCLTHHPSNPPSEDEVIERAARTRAG